MENTGSSSANEDIKFTIPSRFKALMWLADKGMVFLIMGIGLFVMFNLIVEDRKYRDDQIKKQDKQIDDLRRVVDDCAQSKKDQLTQEVQAINLKVDKLLTKQNIN